MGWFLGMFVALAALLSYRLLRPNALKRLQATSVSNISEVVEHEVCKVRGTVSSTGLLRAPYTNRPCVYYRLEFFQNGVFLTDSAVQRQCDFQIEDESGVAEVRVESAVFNVVCDYVEMERASRLSPRALELAKEHKWPIEDIAQVSIREGIVALDEPIDVIGQCVRIPSKQIHSEERGYRGLPATTPIFSSNVVVDNDREPIWLEPQTNA